MMRGLTGNPGNPEIPIPLPVAQLTMASVAGSLLEQLGQLPAGAGKTRATTKTKTTTKKPEPDLAAFQPDGRKCLLCGHRDDETDPVSKEGQNQGYWAWGYSVSPATMKNHGEFCYYCLKTHAARCKHRVSCTDLVAELGRDDAARQQFQVYWDACMDHFKKQGARTGRVPWVAADKVQELSVKKRQLASIVSPEDEFMRYADYVREHGDPSSNCKGHGA